MFVKLFYRYKHDLNKKINKRINNNLNGSK